MNNRAFSSRYGRRDSRQKISLGRRGKKYREMDRLHGVFSKSQKRLAP